MRYLNQLFAWLFGYFWLPCPVCGENFGGHEASFTALVVDEADGQHAYCTCSKISCQEEAMRRNMERGQYMVKSLYGAPLWK
jgi:hypothetical protein